MEELSRACNAACWCIQQSEALRPTMGQKLTLEMENPLILIHDKKISLNISEVCPQLDSLPSTMGLPTGENSHRYEHYLWENEKQSYKHWSWSLTGRRQRWSCLPRRRQRSSSPEDDDGELELDWPPLPARTGTGIVAAGDRVRLSLGMARPPGIVGGRLGSLPPRARPPGIASASRWGSRGLRGWRGRRGLWAGAWDRFRLARGRRGSRPPLAGDRAASGDGAAAGDRGRAPRIASASRRGSRSSWDRVRLSPGIAPTARVAGGAGIFKFGS